MTDRETALRSLLTNIRTGLRIGVMRQFDPATLRVDARQVVLLLLVAFGLGTLSDYIHVEPDRVYNAWGVVSKLASYALMVFGIYLAAQVQRRLERFGLLLVALLAAEPVGHLIHELYLLLVRDTELGDHTWVAWGLYALAMTWFLAIPYWVQRRVFDSGRRRTALATGIYFGVLLLGIFQLPHTGIWYTDEPDDDTPPPPRVDVEATYYAQPALLKADLARLKPQRRGVHDIYFVGVAGWAEQDVFLREVQSVRRLFDERYGTAGRSIVLINNPATVKDVPLANAHNLQAVLDRVGRLMDPKEDMLFLYFSSHGSKDRRIAMSYWPLRLNDITADGLHAMLARSRIGWKTVVISSCYSGGFIEPLKDAQTLIMTAAAANRTSFGCSNENAWTYFGEAYFEQALPHSTSFVGAFHAAEQSIAKREASEKLTPSQPQVWVGERMQAFLPKVEARLAAAEKKPPMRLAACRDGKEKEERLCQ